MLRKKTQQNLESVKSTCVISMCFLRTDDGHNSAVGHALKLEYLRDLQILL